MGYSIDQPLRGKILLVTGGASGMGFCLAQQALTLDARVIVADIQTTPELDSLLSCKPHNIFYVRTDVTQWRDFDKVFHACEEKWHDVPDAYGICAGVFEPPSSNFWNDPEDEGGYMAVKVNLEHPVKLTRLAMRKSLEWGKRASVCIISSIAGIDSTIAGPLYCATKHALVGFVKSLKDTEALTGVKITTLLPGMTETALVNAEQREQISWSAMRALEPETCAKHMLELLQKKECPCGTMLEITLAGPRVIPEWGIERPLGDGTVQDLMNEGRREKMVRPIREALERDKRPSFDG